jgi:hypothetical protein
VRLERYLADDREKHQLARASWPWRQALWPALIAFELAGLVILGVTYLLTKSSDAQWITVLAYALCGGGVLRWRFRDRTRALRELTFAGSTRVKLESTAFLISWGAVVILAIEPASRTIVGPWFAWWLVIVPAIEFDRVRSLHSRVRGVRESEPSG